MRYLAYLFLVQLTALSVSAASQETACDCLEGVSPAVGEVYQRGEQYCYDLSYCDGEAECKERSVTIKLPEDTPVLGWITHNELTIMIANGVEETYTYCFGSKSAAEAAAKQTKIDLGLITQPAAVKSGGADI